MAILAFPPVNTADEDGVLAIGGDLEVESLLLAYQNGIFPWPINSDYPLVWFAPPKRGVIFTDKIHLSKSFKKFLKHHSYEIKFNLHFQEVIDACQKVSRPHQSGTWITDELKAAFVEFHRRGFAYAVSVHDKEKIVGGIYGVWIDQFVSGESMFHYEDNGSKLALYSLLQLLKEKNISMLDTQMITNVVESFGGVYISREEFNHRLITLIN